MKINTFSLLLRILTRTYRIDILIATHWLPHVFPKFYRQEISFFCVVLVTHEHFRNDFFFFFVCRSTHALQEAQLNMRQTEKEDALSLQRQRLRHEHKVNNYYNIINNQNL